MQSLMSCVEVDFMSGEKFIKTDGLRYLPYVLLVVFLYVLYVSFESIRLVGSSDDIRYLHSFESGYNINGNYTWNRWIPISVFAFFDSIGLPPRSLSNLCFYLYVPGLMLANYLLSREILGDRKFLVFFFTVFFTCNITWSSLVSFLRLPLLYLLVTMALSAYVGLQSRKSYNLLLIFASTLVISLSYQSAIYVMVCFVLLTLTAQYVRNDDTDIQDYVLRLLVAAGMICAALIAFLIITKIADLFVAAGDDRYEITSISALLDNLGKSFDRMWRFLWGDYLDSRERVSDINLKTISLMLVAFAGVLGLVFSKLRFKLAIALVMLVVGVFVIGIQPLQLITDHMSMAPRVYGFFQYFIFGMLAVSLMVFFGHSALAESKAGRFFIGPCFYVVLSIVAVGFSGQLIQSAEDTVKSRDRELDIARTLQTYYVINEIDFSKPTYLAYSSGLAKRSLSNYFAQPSHLSRGDEKSIFLLTAFTSLDYGLGTDLDPELQSLADGACSELGLAPRHVDPEGGGFPRIHIREMDDFVMLCLDGPS